MAKFNPDIPDQVPPPTAGLYATRPLSAWDIGVNKTGQTALTGIGSVLGEAIRGADEVIKTNIDQGVRQDLNTEREATTGAMEQILGLPQDQRVSSIQPDQSPAVSPASSSSGAGTDIIPGATAAPVPSALQGVDQSVAGPAAGIKAKPELSTYYFGKQDMIAKDWRARYPGYSDYIDSRVSAITGGNPANERLRTMMTMIQEMQGNSLQQKNKALSLLAENSGYPTARNELALINSGSIQDPYSHVINWLAPWKAIDKTVSDNQKQNEIDISSNKVDMFRNEQTATKLATDISSQMWNSTIPNLSIDKDGQVNPDKLNSFLTDIQTGKRTISEKDGELYGTAISNFAMNVRRTIDDKLTYSGAAQVLGPDKVKAIEDQAVQKYTDLGNMYLSKDKGPAAAATRAIEHDNAEAGKWLLEKSPIQFRNAVQLYSGGVKLVGPSVGGILQFNTIGGKYGSLDDVVAEFGKRTAVATITRPDATLDTAIQYAKDAGVGQGSRPKSDNLIYNYFTQDLPAKIADPTIPDAGRIQLAKNIFSGEIAGRFGDDVVDPSGKTLIPGRHTVLSNMTTKPIVDSVWNLSGQNPNSDLWLQYKNWVTRETNTVGNTDVKNFNSDVATNPNVQVQWDDKNQRFSIDFKPSFNTPINAITVNNYKAQIAKLNTIISPLVDVAKKEGVDPNQFVWRQLNNLGMSQDILNPKEPTLGEKLAIARQGFATQGVEPSLEDYTQAKPSVASDGQIKGTANAASAGIEWGNPLLQDFKTQHLTTIETPAGQKVQVNKKSAEAFQGFLSDLKNEGYPIKNVEGYNLREQRNSSGRISQHAFGNAIDINPDENPKGGKSSLPANVSDLAAKWGLTWGGDWTKKYRDPMHFEYTGRKPVQTNPGYEISSQ